MAAKSCEKVLVNRHFYKNRAEISHQRCVKRKQERLRQGDLQKAEKQEKADLRAYKNTCYVVC